MLIFKILKIFTSISLLLFGNLVHADVCTDWFRATKINTKDKNCLSKCNVFLIDMSTFTCHNECENFCKPKKCQKNLYWKTKVKYGRPVNWDFKTEKNKSWSEEDIKILNKVFETIPIEFEKLKFEGFFRMEKSIQLINPGTTSSEKVIVLYDNAFGHPVFKTERVVVHELAHILYLNFSERIRTEYQRALGWKNANGTFKRKGTFLKQDAQDSQEEDFATNIEYFLFDKDEIKSQLPNAYNWIKNKFSRDFELKDVCHEN